MPRLTVMTNSLRLTCPGLGRGGRRPRGCLCFAWWLAPDNAETLGQITVEDIGRLSG